MTSPQAAETILFRPSKKRKIFRRQRGEQDTLVGEEEEEGGRAEVQARASTASNGLATTEKATRLGGGAAQTVDELIAAAATGGADGQGDEDEDESEVPIAEIWRLRKLHRVRTQGVEFKAGGMRAAEVERGRELVMRGDGREDGEAEGAGGGGVRPVRMFAPQTGTVVDVNKHMMAYIDSQLAKRRLDGVQSTTEGHSTVAAAGAVSSKSAGTAWNGGEAQGQGEKRKELDVQRQPAAQGKLQEIDLGDEVRDRNVERTEQARRRMHGEEVEDEAGQSGKAGKVRLRKDGKPWKGRKRRDSEDVKRDKLVEDVLRENRLEIYEEPTAESSAANDDQAADDRVAEAFRREFMDAVSARQRKKPVPAPPPGRSAGGKKEEEVMKGPKLGGSRSARAAMRETLLKSAKK